MDQELGAHNLDQISDEVVPGPGVKGGGEEEGAARQLENSRSTQMKQSCHTVDYDPFIKSQLASCV